MLTCTVEPPVCYQEIDFLRVVCKRLQAKLCLDIFVLMTHYLEEDMIV